MSIYNIIRNLSVAVLLTTSISFAMDDEGKNSDDVNKVRLRESAFDGMPLLTFGDMDHAALAALFASTSMAGGSVPVNSSSVLTDRGIQACNPAEVDGLPLLTMSAFAALSPSETEAFRAFASSSFASSDPVVSTRLAFEETSEQTIARTTVPANFIDSLLEISGGYVERKDLDESENTSDQAKHIVISLVNRINTLNAREREFANTGRVYTQPGTYTQAQVDAKHAASQDFSGGRLDPYAELYVARRVRDFASKFVPEGQGDSLTELLLMSPKFKDISESSYVCSFVPNEEHKSEFAKMLRLVPEFKDISENNLEKIASASMDILYNATK